MFKTDLSSERQLFAFTYRDLVPDDSDVWLYVDLFDTIDLEDFYFDYSSQGEPAVDPKLMLRTVFYGLTHGMASGRKLAKACLFDCRYVVLSGTRRPDARTLHRFIRRHEPRMADLFAQVVSLAQKAGLVSLGNVAIDGTILKGHTSKYRAVRYGKVDAAIATIKADLKALKDACERENAAEADADSVIPEHVKKKEVRLVKLRQAKDALEKAAGGKAPSPGAKKSFNDLDCVSLGRTMGYNGQIAVDEKSQIVVAAEISDKVVDADNLSPMLDALNEAAIEPQSLLLDAGYLSAENIRAVDQFGAQLFIGVKAEHGTKGDATVPSKSKYEQLTFNDKGYLCLAGKQLPVVTRQGDGKLSVKLGTDFCDGCQLYRECSLYKRRNQKRIQLPPEADRLAMAEIHRRSRSDTYKETYKRRMAIVEPVFGNIKWNKGLRVYVSGKDRVTAWWKMVMTAHNIEKLIGATA